MKFNRFRKRLRPEPQQQPYEEEIRQFEPVPDQYQPDTYQQQAQPPPQQEYGYEQPQQQELTPELIQEIQRMQMEEQLRQQQMQQGIPAQSVPQHKVKDGDNPLSILDEIKARPSPKGTFPILIGGRPVDLHVLEDYITKISPFALKTILRYHNARTIEELKGYSRGGSLKLKGSTVVLILLAIGLAVGGIIMLMYMPNIMEMFKSGL